MSDYLENLKENRILTEASKPKVKIEVEHEGVLEVPEGKNVEDMPLAHFVDLAKRKGFAKISRALINLKVWNREKNKPLSSWADDMQEKVAKALGKEPT
jgi:hypothetical protein